MFSTDKPHLHKTACLLALCVVAAIPCAVFGQATDLAGRVAKLEQSLSNRGLLDLLAEIEHLKRELATMRGEMENQAHTLEQLKKAHATAYVDLDRRLQTLPGGSGADPAAGGASAAPLPVLQPAPEGAVAGAPALQGNLEVLTEGGSTVTEVPGGIDAAAPASPAASTAIDPAIDRVIDPTTGLAMPDQEGAAPASAPVSPLPAPTPSDNAGSETAYRDAFGLLKSGEYDNAIAAFEAFQQQYPDSQYGDNAQFWLAEAHYVKRDFAAALPAYQTMLSHYPASKKLSHAMLKIGYSYSELGQAAEARTVLTDLQQRFPGSAAAQLAAQRLTQLPSNN